MFEERKENGRIYRLFWEDASMWHPEGSAGLIYCMTDHQRIWEYKGLPGETVDQVRQKN